MEQFIDLRALARVRDMELVARSVATGFLHGVQASEQRGVGIEFSQYRAYEPGDAPSRIDWKLYARSDRYFVREAERESETSVWLVLDTSRSMMLGSEQGVWNKFDYGRYLTATLAYLAQSQGDRVGLLTLGGGAPTLIPALAGTRQWHRILHSLDDLTAGGAFPAHENIGAEIARLQGPGLVILISDLHQERGEISDFLRLVSTQHNEVATLRLECNDERDFPFEGPVRFEDLETGESVLANGRAARAKYLSSREQWLTELKRRLSQWEVGLDTVCSDEPLDAGLHAFLERRRRGLVA
ncbi:MAG: DUF58 domain-containing protein [Halieaceae bacterium]|jgi:uncharacterized protein (DUF58 family)|nr:DUF58 domain-containing protein [Halieaceae bacterium]